MSIEALRNTEKEDLLKIRAKKLYLESLRHLSGLENGEVQGYIPDGGVIGREFPSNRSSDVEYNSEGFPEAWPHGQKGEIKITSGSHRKLSNVVRTTFIDEDGAFTTIIDRRKSGLNSVPTDLEIKKMDEKELERAEKALGFLKSEAKKQREEFALGDF